MALEITEFTLICDCGNVINYTRVWDKWGYCETGYEKLRCEKCSKFFAYQVKTENFGKINYEHKGCEYISEYTSINHLKRALKGKLLQKEMLPKYALDYFPEFFKTVKEFREEVEKKEQLKKRAHLKVIK